VQQHLDRVDEPDVSDIHDEVDAVAMRAAAEAMVEALVVVDGERRCPLAVKRAQTDELAAPSGQPYMAADDFGQDHLTHPHERAGVDAIAGVDRVDGRHHAASSLPARRGNCSISARLKSDFRPTLSSVSRPARMCW